MNAVAQESEVEKLWAVVADHQLLVPALCVAALAGVVFIVLRAMRGGPKGS